MISQDVESISCTQNGDDPMKRRRTARILSAIILSAVMAVSPLSAFAADVSGADMNNKGSAGTASAFSDVKTDHWAYDSINTAVKKGWVYGYPDGTFRPDAEVTRAEFVAMLINAMQLSQDTKARLTGEDERSDATNIIGYGMGEGSEFSEMYEDMASSWLAANGYAKLAVRLGIVVNADYSDGSFGVSVPITRKEIAVMTERAMGRVYKAENNTRKPKFSDVSDLSKKTAGYVADSAACGVTSGFPDGTFRPDAKATRAEALAMIDRAISFTEKGETDQITVKAWNHENSSEENALTVKTKSPAIISDGIIYMDALEVKSIWNAAQNDISCEQAAKEQGCYWYPVMQRLVVTGSGMYNVYTSGSSLAKIIYYYWYPHDYFDMDYDVKMLHGRILIPIWNIKKSCDIPGKSFTNMAEDGPLSWERDGRFYYFTGYDEKTQTLTMDVNQFYVTPPPMS